MGIEEYKDKMKHLRIFYQNFKARFRGYKGDNRVINNWLKARYQLELDSLPNSSPSKDIPTQNFQRKRISNDKDRSQCKIDFGQDRLNFIKQEGEPIKQDFTNEEHKVSITKREFPTHEDSIPVLNKEEYLVTLLSKSNVFLESIAD